MNRDRSLQRFNPGVHNSAHYCASSNLRHVDLEKYDVYKGDGGDDDARYSDNSLAGKIYRYNQNHTDYGSADAGEKRLNWTIVAKLLNVTRTKEHEHK